MARPKGSTTRPQIRDFLKPVDIIDLTKEAYKKAKEGDTVMMKFLLEQIYGKAPQSIDLGGDLKIDIQTITGMEITKDEDKISD